ncbi:tetratricopeptide repeat protein [Radiobacillus kanasensis]|uniref:tetratricopeptide repeat protein n=1 Tax=Radiobacillus kanasensis TaxID=2844358 RepID=UPI001E6364BA|nr:tetratricopeptide repeat protein [Radiobacillus kanasensis]UFT97617.1 tetratricopeptide repeat protein [Radiobacillus kanasensis]
MEEIHEAILLMEQNQTEKAIDKLEAFLPSANEEERYTIAELYMQWGMLEDAKAIIIELSQRYPKETELKMLLSEIYIDLEEDEEAIDILNQFTPQDEEYMEALVQLADLYQTQGLFEVAEQKLLEAKQIDPSETVIDFALGELAFSLGEYLKAIPYYEKVYLNQTVVGDTEIGLRLAEAYAASGKFEEALTFYQEADSENPETLFRFGFTAFRADRLDISIQVWEQLMERDSQFPSVYYYLAKAYEQEGMPEDAYETAKEGLKVDDFNKELFHYAGVLAHKLGRSEEGYQLVNQAIELDFGFKEAVLFLVENYKHDQNEEEIVQLLQRVIENGEDDQQYRWELAKAYRELELYEDALKQYHDAYTNFKEDSDFLKEFGYFLVEEGKMNEAQEVFSKYLEVEPSDHEVEEFLQRLAEQ